MLRLSKLLNIAATFVFVATMVTAFASVQVRAGVGVSPGEFINEYVKPGSSVQKSFFITRSQEPESVRVVVEEDINNDMKDWITILPSSEFEIPANTDKFEFSVVVAVPENATLNNYKGFLRLKFLDTATGEGNVAVVQGIRLDLNMTVTNEDYSELIVRKIDISDTEEGETPALLMTIENKGNVDSAPDQVEIKFMDLNKKDLETVTLSAAQLPQVKAGMQEDLTIPFSTTLEAGEYYATVSVGKDEKVLREETMIVNIFTKGQAPSAGQNSLQQFVANNGTLIGIVVIIILFVIALLIVYMSNKKGTRSSKKMMDDKTVK